jgi:hypothetical protein
MTSRNTRTTNIRPKKHKLHFQIATGVEIWISDPQAKNFTDIEHELQEVSGSNLN